MTPESAETLALKVLGWLVSNEELWPTFMGATGADQDAVRQGASDPAFLGSVLDFLLMNDAWVIEACDAIQAPYESVATARQRLPGGEQINWT